MFLALNGIQIKAPAPPRGFTVQHFNLTKARRLASGLMQLDIIAVKRKFLFSYNVISRQDYELIELILLSGESFFTLDYDFNATRQQAIVYSGALSQTAFRTGGERELTGWYWNDFTFDLIER